MATKNAINSANPIEVAKGGTGLASTTAYGVIIGGTTSTGALQNVGAGTSSTYLTSAGSGVNPTWTAATGAGALVLIQTQTASNSASIVFTSGITSTYNNYLLLVSNCLPVTDATTILLRYSTDGGATYVSSSSYLGGYNFLPYNSTTVTNSTFTTRFGLIPACSNSTSNGTHSATAWLLNFTSGVGNMGFVNLASYYSTVANAQGLANIAVFASTASLTCNAIQITSSSGNISTGTFSLYGLAK